MPTTLNRPALDLDAAGRLLVAEIEQYLRSLPAPASPAGQRLDVARLLAAAPVCQYGQTVQPWWAGWPEPPVAGLLDRIRHSRPGVDVSAQDHLRLTSRFIAAHGWCQGALRDHAGRVCVLGAQLAVTLTGYGTEATVRRARQRLGNQLGRLGAPMPVDSFNDLPTTRQADIHQLLDRAATR